MSHRFFFTMLIGLIALALLSGCGRRTPSIVPVQGTVLFNGKPLPKAAVQFVPQREDVGGEFLSTAVTDESGRFNLTCGHNSQPGAVVGKHIVLVTDPPVPEELRNSRDVRAIENHRAKLGNRPIPPKYSSLLESPLKIEIKEGQGEVKLELTR